MTSTIAYSLTIHPVLNVYIAVPYVVEIDRDGHLGYMERRGTPEVLSSYSFYDTASIHKIAVDLCLSLSDETILSKYVKSPKATLASAIEETYVKNAILTYVNKKMHQFLSYAVEHSLPLCLGIQRKMYLQNHRIQPSSDQLQPHLHFSKSSDGIVYTLAIRHNNLQWYPAERDIIIVNDRPGWLIESQQLYKLKDVNGNKLKPFLNKIEVQIPDRIAQDYLEKFVKDIITKVPVKTEGFEIEKYQDPPIAELVFHQNFISGEWMLELRLHYGDETFLFRKPDQTRTRILYGEGGKVKFRIYERDKEREQHILDKLQQEGLHMEEDLRLRLKWPSQDDPYELLLWVRDHIDDLRKHQIRVLLPQVGDYMLSANQPSIEISHIENNDWFDIRGIVTIGEYQLPFLDLIDSIRTEERLFPLPDGTCFIIPSEWMTKYASLARWAKEEGDHIQILRSQYTLIEEIGSNEPTSATVYKTTDTDVPFTPSVHLRAQLRPYQLEGAQWLVNHQEAQLGCCLADDMGLGKTLQTLCALLYAREHIETADLTNTAESQLQLNLFEQSVEPDTAPLRALIIMPASLIFNWHSEIKKFAPDLTTLRHIGPKRHKKSKDLLTYDIVLTSYQTTLRDTTMLSQIQWSYIVLDESQYIKNHTSKIFGAIQELPSQYKLSLSGTPIENSLSDLWSQMQFINPDILGSYSFFKKHFQLPIERHHDETLLEELKQLTGPYILRRTKEEVLKELPSKTEQVIFCEMTSHQAKIYEKEKSAARNLLLLSDMSDPQVKMQIFTSLLRLRQIANHPRLYLSSYKHDAGKFEILIENLITIWRAGHKALIFSSFTAHLDLVADSLRGYEIPYALLTGQTSQENRRKAVQQFQEQDSKTPFFLISIKAGGTGLNLTAADYVYLLDPWWNPFVEEQAIARAHRIGLDHPLTVVRYITADSIEEKIQQLQAQKKALSEDILGVNTMPEWSKEEIGYLLQ